MHMDLTTCFRNYPYFRKRLSQPGKFWGNLPPEFIPGSKGRRGQIPVTGTTCLIIIYSHQLCVWDVWKDLHLRYQIGCWIRRTSNNISLNKREVPFSSLDWPSQLLWQPDIYHNEGSFGLLSCHYQHWASISWSKVVASAPTINSAFQQAERARWEAEGKPLLRA